MPQEGVDILYIIIYAINQSLLTTDQDLKTLQQGAFFQVEETRDNVETLQKEVAEVKKDVGEIKEDLKTFITQTQASFNLIMKALDKSKD